jgi:hypothetical protein
MTEIFLALNLYRCGILRARVASKGSPEWIHKHILFDLLVTPHHPGNDILDDVMIENLVAFAWELHKQVQLTSTPNLILARAFEEVADATAARFSLPRAGALYYVALQYDPDNILGIASKVKQSSNGALWLADSNPC